VDGERRRVAAALAASVIAGLGLRLWNLRGQVMGGDELHAVRVVARQTIPEILTTYRVADVSIPFAALHRLLMEWGVTLSEIDFRLPALICGCLALWVIPRVFRDRLERAEVELLGWLVAFSPVLVLYSRIARSYLPMVLAGFGAVMAFERWWRTRTWKAGLAYVLLATLAVWIHLGAGPLVVAPFLFAVGDLVPPRREGRWPGLLALTALGAALTAAFALFLVPARESLLRLIAGKRQEQAVRLDTILDVLHLQAGTGSSVLSALFWTAAMAGLILLLRDRPRLGAFTLTAAAGHVAGMFLLSPLGMGSPVVLNRYVLPVLPFVLLWVAYALGRPWNPERGCLGQTAQRMAARFFVLALFWVGPFPQAGFRDSSFMHHNDFVGFFAPRASLPSREVPAVYRSLAGGPVLELPWAPAWDFNRVFYIYQQVHEQRVMISAPFDLPRHPRIDLRNEVPPEPAALLASPARHLVVHLRIAAEEDRVLRPPDRPPSRPMPPQMRRLYRREGERLARQLTREWGPPDYADDLVRVWDLERLRRRPGG
jgi:hypothetical protein